MMWWHDGDISGWGWAAMSVGMVLFWGLLILGGVLLVRAMSRPPREAPGDSRPAPEQVLADRFARGEIDEEEYRQRLETLRSSTAEPAGRL
jgi:putative membrane protein